MTHSDVLYVNIYLIVFLLGMTNKFFFIPFCLPYIIPKMVLTLNTQEYC